MSERQSLTFTKSDYHSQFVMRLISFILCAIITIFGNGDCDYFKVVYTSDGAVRGVKNTTEWQKCDYHAFKGIPYAEPPMGDLRFKVNISHKYDVINYEL